MPPKRVISGSVSPGSATPVSALARYRQLFLELLDGGPLQPGDVHLRDSEPLGDLRLGQFIDEAQVHYPPLTRRQVAHRLIEQVLELHLVEVLVFPTETFGELETIVVPGRGPGGLEGDGPLRGARLHRLQYIFWRQLEFFSDFVHRRLATEFRLQPLRGDIGTLHRFLEAARHLDRPALVPEVPLDFANDGRRGEGRKLQAPLRLEALDRGEQADVADLDNVLEWLPAAA